MDSIQPTEVHISSAHGILLVSKAVPVRGHLPAVSKEFYERGDCFFCLQHPGVARLASAALAAAVAGGPRGDQRGCRSLLSGTGLPEPGGVPGFGLARGRGLRFGSGSGRAVRKSLYADSGWVHYLAFDLFVGCWEMQDSHKHQIPHAVVVPCLLFTFLLGPVGLVGYLLVRWVTARQWKVFEGS